MAVIESKGNGYALFNGVKLPSLPEWDKETYPYAYVCKIAATSFGCFYSSAPFKMSAAGKLSVTVSGTFIHTATISGNLSAWGNASTLTKNEGFEFPSIYVPIWSNYDILNASNSVYLSATELIVLDGMNVIEWDGNTEGLEVFPQGTGYYHVSSATNINVDKSIVVTRKSYDYIRSPVKEEGYYKVGVEARIVITESELFPTVGVFLKSSSAYTTSLFAYCPIEQEPTDDMSKGKLLLLS